MKRLLIVLVLVCVGCSEPEKRLEFADSIGGELLHRDRDGVPNVDENFLFLENPCKLKIVKVSALGTIYYIEDLLICEETK